MPKKTRRSKTKKSKKVARKQTKKSIKKPVRKKLAKRKPVRKKAAKKKAVRKKAPSARKTAGQKSVKSARPPMKSKPSAPPLIAERPIGIVTHYYSHLSVAVVKLDQGPIQVGDMIHFKGHTTDFQQRAESMQIEHESIQRADIGQEFGLMVSDHVREHDIVYKLTG
jgi:hypothetical protein